MHDHYIIQKYFEYLQTFHFQIGMYPPKSKTVWNTEINWQPIPVHTVPELEDELLAMRKPCPAYDTELERVMHSKPYKERLRKYQHLME